MDAELAAAVRTLSGEITGLLTRVQRLEGGTRTAGLKYSSIDGGALTVKDGAGTARTVVGAQPDGSYAVAVVNAPPPAVPAAPAVLPLPAGLGVSWDGKIGGAAPLADFRWCEVHLSPVSGFTPGPDTVRGTLHAAGSLIIAGLTPGTPYYAVLVARSQSGAGSQSAQASGTPVLPAGINATVGPAAPSSPGTGDLWWDEAHDYRLNQWSGTAWAPYKVGTSAIADGAVTTAQIAAAAGIVGSQLSSAAGIVGGQIAASTITAGLLAVNIIKAGIVDGTTISAASFVAYGTNGEVLIYAGDPAAGNLLMTISPLYGQDSWGNPWDQGITLTALAGLTNLFTVRDTAGSTLAGIDAAGNISGQVINAAADLQVGGASLVAAQAALPAGLVNYGYIGVGGTAWPSGAVSTEQALFELDQDVTGGRIYQFTMNQSIINTNTAAVRVHLVLRYTTDGSTPSTSSPVAVTCAANVPSASADTAIGPVTCPFFPGANGTYRFLVTGYASAGTFQFKNDQFIRCIVDDLGANTGQGSNNMTVLGSGGGGGGASPQNYTEYFYPAHTYSYYSDSGLRNTDSSMFHGAYSGEAPAYQYSYIAWGTGSLGRNLNTVLNYQVNSAALRLTNLHSWYNNGMTFGLHSATSLGSATWSVLLGSYFIAEGNTYEFAWNSSVWAPFKAGGTTYLVLAPDAGNLTNLNWYGYFYGGGGSTGSMPRLRVNYTH